MTPSARICDAESVVREQRATDLGGPTGIVADSVEEAFVLQELERLQAAVMGESP